MTQQKQIILLRFLRAFSAFLLVHFFCLIACIAYFSTSYSLKDFDLIAEIDVVVLHFYILFLSAPTAVFIFLKQSDEEILELGKRSLARWLIGL